MAKVTTAPVTPKAKELRKGRGGSKAVVPEDEDNDTVTVAVRTDESIEQLPQQPHITTPLIATVRNEMPSSNTRGAGKLRRPSSFAEVSSAQVRLPQQHHKNRSRLVDDPTKYREDTYALQETPESKAVRDKRAIIGRNQFSPTKKQKRAQKRLEKANQQKRTGAPSLDDAIQADRQLQQEDNSNITPQENVTQAPNTTHDESKEKSVSPQTSRKRKREEIERARNIAIAEEEVSAGQEVSLNQVESLIPEMAIGRQLEQRHTLKTPPPTTLPSQQARKKRQHRKQVSVDSLTDLPVREGHTRDNLSTRRNSMQTKATEPRRSPRLSRKKDRINTEQPGRRLKITQISTEEVQFEDQPDGEAQINDESEDKVDEYWQRYPSVLQLKRSLGRALGGVLEFERESDITLADVQKNTIVKLCKEIEKQLTRLRNGSEGENEPANNLVDLDAKLSAMQSKEKMAETEVNIQKSYEIFAVIIPRLIRLICHQRNCYFQIDREKRRNAHHPLSIGHVDALLNTVTMVLNFVDTAHNYPQFQLKKKTGKNSMDKQVEIKYRQYCTLHVRPNLKEAIGTLRKMRKDFADDEQIANEHRKVQQTQRLRAVKQEDDRRLKAINRVRERWRRLHEERRAAEGGFLAIWARGRQDAYDSLRDPDYWPHELDFNGEPFERLEVFSQRSGPPPQMIEEARSRYWSTQQIQALGAVLKRFAEESEPDDPDMMLVKIFRSCCYQRGPLVDFNVTDIVTKVADLKAFFIEKGYQGDWIEAIPDWVKPLRMEGVENGQ